MPSESTLPWRPSISTCDAFYVDDFDDEDEQWSGDEDDSQLSPHLRGHDKLKVL